MFGFELIKVVWESGFFFDIFIIIFSSFDSLEDCIKCFKLGVDDYMMKFFNLEELLI